MFLPQPQSVSPVSGSSLGIFPLVAALCRVHSAEAAQGDHPDLLQPLEMRIVILLFPGPPQNPENRYQTSSSLLR